MTFFFYISSLTLFGLFCSEVCNSTMIAKVHSRDSCKEGTKFLAILLAQTQRKLESLSRILYTIKGMSILHYLLSSLQFKNQWEVFFFFCLFFFFCFVFLILSCKEIEMCFLRSILTSWPLMVFTKVGIRKCTFTLKIICCSILRLFIKLFIPAKGIFK